MRAPERPARAHPSARRAPLRPARALRTSMSTRSLWITRARKMIARAPASRG